MATDVEVVLDAHAELGEGAIWHAQRQVLYWVDILKQQVHVFNPKTRRNRTIQLAEPVGTVVPRKAGGVMVAAKHGFAHLDLNTEMLAFYADPEPDKPGNRFNDGKCDPAGRFWAGTMPMSGSEPTGSLYCLFPDRTVKKMLSPVTVSNGIAWSLDARTMYFIDTPRRVVDAFDYDFATANISNRRDAIVVPPELGWPDGCTIDAEGMLWIAHYGGGCVTRWNPQTGALLAKLPVPATNVTSVAFGGATLDVLYITTARAGLSPLAIRQNPHEGALFATRPGVTGIEAFEFAG
ncbi:MAG: SMP-30/gluconolactonase/LRE family protein [Verrucomicrobiae bacterium]|nr:SMP-30/gluconolactonase/LRE family protein [Verrucomicrobiae bacterium]